jgi:hypothetical protein
MKTLLRQAAGQSAERGSFVRGRLPSVRRILFLLHKMNIAIEIYIFL